MFKIELVGVFFQGHADSLGCEGFVSVVVALHCVDGAKIGGGDSAVGFQADVAIEVEELQNIVRVTSVFLAVVLGLAAFGKAEVVRH